MNINKMKIPDLFRRSRPQALDELISSLPILKSENEPDNREHQCLVLSVGDIGEVLHAQYAHSGMYIEKPVGFSYVVGRDEHKFSLSRTYRRIPVAKDSIILPLTSHEQGLPVSVDPSGNPIEERDLHGLGIKVDDQNVLPLFIFNKGNSEPAILLCAEPEYSYLNLDKDELIRKIEDATGPIQSAKRQHRFRELGKRRGPSELDWSNAPSIVEYLDQYIIGQPHAKRAIAVAFSNYMVRREIDDEELPKDNLLLIGGTGTGKTQSIRLLAERAKVPFFKTQMTGKSSSGYVGDPFLKFFSDIAKSSRSSAPYAVVFLDELDKLVDTQYGTIRGELQGELVGILEEGYVAGINTRNILFVAAGAFSRNVKGKSLRQLISERTGVNAESQDVLKAVQQRDVIDYGLMEELVGRLPVIGVFDPLSIDDKVRILKESKGSVLRNYLRMFGYKGYRVEVDDNFPRFIAEHTAPETGARGLHSVCNEVLQEIFYNPEAFTQNGIIYLNAELARKTMQLYKKSEVKE